MLLYTVEFESVGGYIRAIYITSDNTAAVQTYTSLAASTIKFESASGVNMRITEF